MDKNRGNTFLWILMIVLAIMFSNFFKSWRNQINAIEEINYTEFTELINNNSIKSATLTGGLVEGIYVSKVSRPNKSLDQEYKFKVLIPKESQGTIADLLAKQKVKIDIKEESEGSFWTTLFFSFFPIIIFVGFWIFIMRQMQGGGRNVMAFGKSKAKLSKASGRKITFKDVAGIEEAKEELSEIIDFLKDPGKFQKLGGRIPKGVLLTGPPGTGKTLLAKAIAGEAEVPFFSISGSDFVEMFVGVGASRVRDLFEQGKKNAPCIIFIDELDAVGRRRGAGIGGGHDEKEQTLNQLLVEMDGFESNEGVIIIAATNRPDVLDPAILRPGRFDRQVVISLPDIKGREAILRIHSRRVPMEESVDLSTIARGTPGFSGAQLANLINEAALAAARFDRKKVTKDDLEEAKDKVLMGKERKSLVMSSEEKRSTAFHEAGHALVALFLPEADPLHKVTIIPRGRALGVTMQLPEEDTYNYSKEYAEAKITILLAGRVSEKKFLGKYTTGASNDIEIATSLARKMICEWGMSDDMGPINFGGSGDEVFLGYDLARRNNHSEDTAKKIDEEIKKIIIRCQEKAKKIIDENKETLEKIAMALLEFETLDLEKIKEIMTEYGI